MLFDPDHFDDPPTRCEPASVPPLRAWLDPFTAVSSDPLLTADEVAALLRVTKSWVYAETRVHRIPHVPLGRYVRYRESAIIAWLEELEDVSGPALNGAR